MVFKMTERGGFVRKKGVYARCCICGAEVEAYHNPDPIRDGNESCCDLCNLLVRGARWQMGRLSPELWENYREKLRGLSYEELKEELLNTPEVVEY